MKIYSREVLLTLCIFQLSFLFVNGKEQIDTTKIKVNKFSVEIIVGRLYPFRTENSNIRRLTLTHDRYESSQTILFALKDEIGVSTYTAAIHFEFLLTKKLLLNTGFNYTNLFYQTKKNTTFYRSRRGNASLYTQYDTITYLQINENLYHISFPVCLKYRITNKKIFNSFGIGLSYEFLYRNDVILTDPFGGNQTFNEKSPLELYPSLFANYALFYKLNRHMAVGIEPEIKYFVQNFNQFYLSGNLVLKF